MAKVLLIDDDVNLAELLKPALESEGWTVELAFNGSDGLQLMQNFRYDIVLLDWQMPGMSGIEVLDRYRAEGGDMAVIFLTGRREIEHKESGLDSGADDYLTKPFDVRELLARMRSMQRRAGNTFQKGLQANGAELDMKIRVLRYEDKEIKLSATEFSIVEFFFRHPNQLFSSAEVFDRVWPSETEAKADTIRVHLHVLRRKLTHAGVPELVKTVKGSGYILETKK